MPSDPPWPHGPLGVSAPAWSQSGDLPEAPGEEQPGEPPPDALEFIELRGERYTLGNLLGEGGMGRVVVAEDRVLRRQVALKALNLRARDAGAQRRLAREAWITAQLDHPGIVAVHDAGRLPDGTPFYTMRLVNGRSLAEALERAPDPNARLGLVRPLLAACEAVAYAHQAGIIHRDLKPANILVGGFGETQVVDWGLACPLGAAKEDWAQALEIDGASDATRVGAVVGTPAFMAPEQARGEPVDTRADVFALGATLFAVLTGQGPHGDLDSDTALRRCREGKIPRVREVFDGAAPELAAIADRALSPDPDARYADAGALAADLANWFEGRQVAAHSYSSAELAQRLFAAWRAPIWASLVAAAVISVAIAVSTARVRSERDRALEAEREARAAQERSDATLARALVAQALDALADNERANAEVYAAEALGLVDSPDARGVLAAFGIAPRPQRVEVLPTPSCLGASLSQDGASLLCLNEGRAALWSLGADAPRWSVEGDFTDGLAGSPDTPAVLTIGNLPFQRMLAVDRVTGEVTGEVLGAPTSPLSAVTPTHFVTYNTSSLGLYDLDGQVISESLGCGRSLAVATLAGDELLRICGDGRVTVSALGEPPHRTLETPFFAKREPTAMVMMPALDGLVLATHRGELAIVDAQTGAVRHSVESALGLVRALRVSPDGRRVAAIGVRGGVRIWDPSTGLWVAALPGEELRDIAWTSDTELMVLGERLSRWSLPTQAFPYHVSLGSGVSGLDFTPDGARVAVAQGGGLVTIVPIGGEAPMSVAPGFVEVAKAVACSPDGRWAATTSRTPPQLAMIDVLTGEVVVPERGGPYKRMFFDSDGELVGLNYGRNLQVHDAASFDVAQLVELESLNFDAGASPDGRWAVLVSATGMVSSFDGETHAVIGRFTHPDAVAVDVFPDGQRLAIATLHSVLVTDLAGEVLLTLPAPGAAHRDVAVSGDGALVAAGGLDGVARVWSTLDGRLVAVLSGHSSRVSALQFSPTEALLATGSWDETLRVWDLRDLDTPVEALGASIRQSWGVALDDVLAGQ